MVILGLGSNVGDRLAHLAAAVRALAPVIRNMQLSRIFESEAVLPEGATADMNLPYLNMALSGDCSLSPEELLQHIKSTEVALGRIERCKWGPREIDIDILAWDGVVLESPTLNIPHPELLKRDFALLPLAEVAGNWEYLVHGDYYHHTPSEIIRKMGYGLHSALRDSGLSLSNTTIVGILNITPDSFSDGGESFTRDATLKRIETLIAEGVDIIDIGAESTRPGAIPLTPEAEWKRLEPVMEALEQFPSISFSIDTRHPETVRKIVPMRGIAYINDVSGFANPAMIEAAQQSVCKLVIMHSLTIPADKNVVMPESEDVVSALIAFASDRISALEKAGIARNRLIFDPGIGFGKTSGQSLQIIREIDRFKSLGVPLYIGHSRKSFLADYDRDAATLVVSQFLLSHGIEYIRVHDIAAHKKLITLINALS